MPQTRGLAHRNVFPHGPAGWRSKVKVFKGLVPSEAPPLALSVAAFTLCPHLVFPPCVSLTSLSCEDPTPVRLD